MKRVLLESLVVALIGAAVSFAANQLSPRGLRLARNYFPAPPPAPKPSETSTNQTAGWGETNALSAAQRLAARLKAQGLSLLDSNQVLQLFQDPRYRQGQIMFIDARDDSHYEAEHIPGAYQLDYYRPEKYLPTVLQAAMMAEQIVIYCNGGDCEDSELTANMLATAIPKGKLFVYGGGYTEWTNHVLPVEIGARNSGNLRQRR